jgi:hypothetical protein
MQRGSKFLPRCILSLRCKCITSLKSQPCIGKFSKTLKSSLERHYNTLHSGELCPKVLQTPPFGVFSATGEALIDLLQNWWKKDLIKQSLIISAKPILEECFEALRTVFLPQHRYHMECGVPAPIFCRNYSQ